MGQIDYTHAGYSLDTYVYIKPSHVHSFLLVTSLVEVFPDINKTFVMRLCVNISIDSEVQPG